MAAAMPLPQARGDFLKRVRAFCQDLYKIGSPEVKVATFIFENTICYQEFETAKRLTLDEFVNGRKRSNGERLGPGCGFKDRANASKALTNLEKRGFIAVESDPHDAARKKKFYRLTLPSLNRCCQIDNTCEQDAAILPSNVVEMTTRCSQIDNTMLSEQQQSVVESTTRTGEEGGEVLREVPIVSTSIAPIGASVEVEEVKYPLQGHKAIAQAQEPISISPTRAQLERDLDRARNDLRNAKQHGGTSKRIKDLERAINDIHAQIAALASSSDSQEQENEPTRTALYEEKPQDEKPALHIVPPLKVHQQQYIEWQAELANKRQSLEDWKSATSAAEEEWRTCPTTSKRRELHLEYLACQDEVRRLEHSIAKAEIFLQLIEDGAEPADAAKEAKERAGLQPLHDDHSNEPEQPALPEMEAEPTQETQEEKQPATLYQVLGSLFYDMEHASKDDKQAVAVVATRIEKRGLTIEDVQERYRRWLRKFDALKAKTIWHFEKNIAAQGVC